MNKFTNGPGYRLTFCDLCGAQKYVKDIKPITEKFSIYFGKLSCRDCYIPINPQQVPFVVTDKIRVNPKTVRTERIGPDVIPPDADQLPGPPTNIRIQYDFWNECLRLDWDAPIFPGSGAIQGYKITRAEPQLAFHQTIEANTGINAPYYIDTTADSLLEYTYVIYAINSVGTGTASAYAYWPVDNSQEGVSYIADGNGFTLQDGDGNYIEDGASV